MESDPDDWPARAASDSALIAATLLHLSHASWPPPPPPKKWGRRARRTRVGARPPSRIHRSKKVRRRPSPLTPLDYGASECRSDKIAKAVNGSEIDAAGGCDGPETKVVIARNSELLDFRILDAKLAGQLFETKKKTPPELHAVQRSLLEHREFLRKELEVRWRAKAALVSKNNGLKRLQLSMKSQRRLSIAAQMREEVHPKRLRSCNTFIELPDLNIPVIGESD